MILNPKLSPSYLQEGLKKEFNNTYSKNNRTSPDFVYLNLSKQHS